jgi:Trk K+ transport system NAD-binding subunit
LVILIQEAPIMEQPIILCGLGRVGWRVLELLHAAKLPVVVIDTKATSDDPRLLGARLVPGDIRQRDVLEQAGVRQARGVLILTSDDLLNITVTLTIRALNPEVRIVLRMFNQNLLQRLGQTVRNIFTLSTSTLTAPILAVTALTGQGLGSLSLPESAGGRRQLAEVQISSASTLCARPIVEAIGARAVQILAHLPSGGSPRFLLDVDLDAKLAPGDELVICGEPKALSALVAECSPAESSDLLWAGYMLRLWRVVRRTLGELDRAVLITTVVLITVVLFSTIVLHFGSFKWTMADALFHTVSVMATGSGLGDANEYTEWMKVFVASLRIVGAAILAAFTAILTNYLVRARLGSALEVRRIPEGGHIIVCGLGTIGYRVVEELISLGKPVVVIEVASDNRFVVTARRLGAVVIIGDATVSEVLRQANAATARAVVAATTTDLVNLEVALLVRELNPAQRVVLLQSDPQLAQMLREGANVRLALSVPALSAPAFVAGLYGDRVLAVFWVRGRLLAVKEVVVTADDAVLIGQSVRAVAVDYHFLPLALLPAQGPPPSRPLEARLAVGDRLVAILSFNDLQNLLQRQPAPADFAVEVTACPLPTRGWLIGLARARRGLNAEDAEKVLEHLPYRLGDDLTRGQAEDLLAQLVRERVAARLGPKAGGVKQASGERGVSAP